MNRTGSASRRLARAALAGLSAGALSTMGPSLTRGADVVSTWNGTTANWGLAGNWLNVPATANFPNNGNGGFTYDAIINSGNVTLDVPITIQRLSFTNGTLTGSQNLTMLQGWDWNAGTITGGGVITLGLGATATFATAAAKDINGAKTVNLMGTSTWTNGQIRTGSGAVINNSGTFLASFDGLFQGNLGGTSALNNSGLVQKTGGTNSTTFNVVFNNAGTVLASIGTITLGSGGTHTGSFTGAAGTAIVFSSNHEFQPGSSVTAPSVTFSAAGATVNYGGLYNPGPAGTTTFSGGTITFNSTADVVTVGSTLNLSTGIVNFSSGEDISVPTLNLSGGVLQGSSNFTISSLFNWSGGALQGTGTATLPLGATLSLTTTAAKDLNGQRTLNLIGNSTWSAGQVRGGNGGVFNNSGTFTTNFDGSFLGNLGGTSAVNNSGLVQKSGGSNSTTFNIVFNNSGTVLVSTGTLIFSGGGTHTGSFNGVAGTTLDVSGGHNFQPSSSITVPNVTFSSGTSNINGTYNPTASGSTTISSGQVNFNSSANLVSLGSVLTVSGGSVNFSSGETLSTPTFNFSSGSLGGTDPLTISSAFNWNGGSFGGTGTTTIPAGATATLATSAAKDVNGLRTLNLAGTTIWTGGQVRGGNGAVINNSGTFTTNFDGFLLGNLGGTSALNNSGLFQKTAGAGTTSVSMTFNNSGSVIASTGSISFSGGGSHTGTFSGAAGTSIDFGGGTHNFQAPASVTFPSIAVSANAVNFNGGTYDPGPSGSSTFSGGVTTFTNAANLLSLGSLLTVSGGAVNFSSGESSSVATFNFTSGSVSGTDTMTISSVFNWNGGSFGGTGTTTVAAGATANLATVASKDINGQRTLNLIGNTSWTSGQVRGGNGGVINNSGTFTTNFDGFLSGNLGGTSALNNSGLFQKTAGAGTTSVSMIFNNSGTVLASTGTVSFSGGGSHSGSFTAASGAGIIFNGGTHNLNGAVVNGSGTIGLSSLFNFNSGTFNPTNTILDSSTATFAVDASSANYTQSNGTLAGGANFTATSAFVWQGGTMTGTGTTIVPLGVTAVFSTASSKDINNGRTLNLLGNSSWTGGQIRGGNGAVINSAGTFATDFDGFLQATLGGSSTLNNAGLFQKTGGTGVTSIGMTFNNQGTILAAVGTIELSGGGGSGAGTIQASAGASVRIAGGVHSHGNALGEGTLQVTGGTLNITGLYSVDNTNLTGGTLALTPSPAAASKAMLTKSLSIATNSAKLDLGNNALVVDYTGTSPLPAIRTAIRGAFNPFAGSHWLGNGITSSLAAANPSIALAYGEASRVLNITGTQTATFAGRTVDPTAVLVRYARFGDANLDGSVNFTDLVALAQNYNTNVAASFDDWWSHGDFTYDGMADFSDLVVLAQNYNTAIATPPILSTNDNFLHDLRSIPEPATPGIIASALVCMCKRGRGRRKCDRFNVESGP